INISGIATHEVVIVPPVAKMAQQVTGYSFVANWEAVPDATGYYLTVFTATDQESTIKENFANGLNLLGGWTTNANATTTSTTYSGDAPPALALRTNGDYLQTDMFNSQATSLSFILKSSTGYNCKLYVNAWNGTEFVKIDSIDIILGLSDTLIYNFTENDNYSAFKLEYSTPTSGNIFIDDVAVTFANTINIIISNKWVEGTSDTITGLSAETDYYYKVKASDKKIRPDSSVVYENITSFSNTIHIKTNEPSAVVPVFADEPNSIVSVYNVLGQLLFQTSGDKFAINQLPKKQMLIVKLGNKTMKIVVN
ncbi:MAG: hypothetical protein LBV75_00645, partial [Paludibacter sp.]|nr:hypothetical protein [Paludibacter sp.]